MDNILKAFKEPFVLDISNGTVFSQDFSGKHVTLDDVKRELLKFDLAARELIKIVDLSDNDLFESDLNDVVALLAELPNVWALDLSLCPFRITDTNASYMTQITRIPSLRRIFLFDTFQSTFSGGKLFDVLETRDMGKLIFIGSLADLSSKQWFGKVRNVEHRKAVIDAHCSFFVDEVLESREWIIYEGLE